MESLLYIHWHVQPEIFRIGGFAIRWYGLLFVLGFVVGYGIFRWFFRREKVSEKLLDPLLYTLLIATIVGARLGHCIFYQPGYFFGSWEGFLEIFMPWKGGLASHGGAIALVLAMLWFSHKYGPKNGFDFWWIMDRLVIPVCFAGAFIRLGNFFNSELYGNSVTTLPWGTIFELRGETLPKHPTQLYESLYYALLGLGLLALYYKKLDKLNRGTIFGIFLILLFGFRFFIEYIKEATVFIDLSSTSTIDMGQLLSIPFVVAGVVILIWSLRNGKPATIDPPAPTRPAKKEATHYAKSLRND